MAYPGHSRDATFVLNLAPQRIIVFVIHHGTHGARCLSNGGNSSAWSASTGAIRGRPSEDWRADDGDVTISRSAAGICGATKFTAARVAASNETGNLRHVHSA